MFKAVLESQLREINVTGVPGSGKTSLVVDISKAKPNSNFLYLSFGKENAKNSSRRMPGNVFCSSFHSLAKNLLCLDSNRIVDEHTMLEMNHALKSIGINLDRLKILESLMTLNHLFCTSNIKLKRVHDLLKRKEKIFPYLDSEERTILLKSYKIYWEELWKTDSKLTISHSMYLKKFELSKFKLDYDYLIIDETQDLNSTMFSIVENLSKENIDMTVIKLGDPAQQIYSFIGSSSHFARSTFQFRLNETHRFGQKVCSLANEFMEAQCLDYYTPIISSNNKTKVSKAPDLEALVCKIKNGLKPTFIARYNMTLWHLLKIMSKAGVTCSLNGSDQSELEFLKDLHTLYIGGKVNSAILKNISYERYFDNAKLNDDRSALLACKFVKNIGEDGKEFFDTLKKSLTTKSKADVLLTTVHQAKGLEFEHLYLMDDFAACRNKNNTSFVPIEKEEAHLIYTAITRAKSSLYVPRSWSN